MKFFPFLIWSFAIVWVRFFASLFIECRYTVQCFALLQMLGLAFISPARRGRGILVAPGFCPASRFLKNSKTTGQFFFEILTSHS